MSFEASLRAIVDGCGGGIAAALMGVDGIPIAQVEASGGGGRAELDDIAIAGVEFGRILEEVRKASDALAGGPARECVFALQRFTVVIHSVDEENFVALALLPDGNLGKARYLIRRHLLPIRDEL
ncbi:MAG: hypothetical protein R3E88_09945 [Myxococcota bacterium]|nr:hypothetical protein [Myxococcales bacterium]